MSALVLDAGAFLAIERDDRATVALLRAAQRGGRGLRTTAVVVAQVWRDGARQAQLARVLHAVHVQPVDEQAGREAGVLVGRAGSSDVVDATVALAAHRGDRILTSDPDDLRLLVDALGRPVVVVGC